MPTATGDSTVESKYVIDAGKRLIHVRVWGEMRAQGLIALMRRIGSDPLYRPDMDAIVDLREAHGDWDYSEIQRLRDFLARAAGSERRLWAGVMSPGPLAAAARMLIVISEPVVPGLQMQLFDEPRSAVRWIRASRRVHGAFLPHRAEQPSASVR